MFGLILLTGLVAALACQVPVFRYALERWEPDRYEVVVEASGDLSPSEREAVDFLIAKATDREMPTNLIVRSPDAEEGASAAAQPATMSLHPPARMRGILTPPIWSGPVTMENAGRMIDSPARLDLMHRILKGESAIWVMVESGDADKDQAAEAQLRESMAEAGSTLKIPDGVVGRDSKPSPTEYVDPENVLQSDVPLKIDFSVLRVSRTDPQEEIFLQMLLSIESDLGEYAAEPMAFPVFGRGRFLEPLIGLGVTRDNVFEASMYLCGACSCEVKDQNPGRDLLMSMNWDMAMEGSQVIIDKILPPLEGVSVLAQAQSPMAVDPALETTADTQEAVASAEPAIDPSNAVAGDGEGKVEGTGKSKVRPKAKVDPKEIEKSMRADMWIAFVTVVVLIVAVGSFYILRRRQP